MNQDVIAGLLGPWSAELGLGAILLRAALSVLFSAVIGCERSSKRHSAGLRTFILVSITGTAAPVSVLGRAASSHARRDSVRISFVAIVSVCGRGAIPDLPYDGCLPHAEEVFVGAREMAAAEEPAVD